MTLLLGWLPIYCQEMTIVSFYTDLQHFSSSNLLGGTILPGFLFQKRYVSSTACWLPVHVTLIIG